MPISNTYLNGRRAGTDDLARLAFAGYAHFTAMQVRDRGVRGLDLHLDRLRAASDELFGLHLPDDRIREFLASAAEAAPPDASLSCYITTRPGEFARASDSTELDVLVKVTEPVTPPPNPVTLAVYAHERHLPHIKHVGEVSKTQLLRRANADGFDDAAFADSSGRLSEATIWNLAFWDGSSVIWPEAGALLGVTMQIVRRQLRSRGVAQTTRAVRPHDLDESLAGVVMNSWSPGLAVSRIGERSLPDAGEFVRILAEAYDAEPPTRL